MGGVVGREVGIGEGEIWELRFEWLRYSNAIISRISDSFRGAEETRTGNVVNRLSWMDAIFDLRSFSTLRGSRPHRLEKHNGLAKARHVIRLAHDPIPIIRHHKRARLRTGRPQVNIGRVCHVDDVPLAAFRVQARLVVVVEEGVVAGAVGEDVGAVDDSQRPGFVAVGGGAGGEGGVGVGALRGEGLAGGGVGLEVGGFGLEGAGEDVVCVGDLED